MLDVIAKMVRSHGHGAVIINGRLVVVCAVVRVNGRNGIEATVIPNLAEARLWMGY